jgi:hypothetical protein
MEDIILMSLLTTSIFASPAQRTIGVGFHNVGSGGVLRASNTEVVRNVEAHYGARCGHIPLNAEKVCVLVHAHTADIQAHLAYLSQLVGKEITAIMADELKYEQQRSPESPALVVPYINVPEAEQQIQAYLGAESWGLPGKMVTILKNKADFYQLLDELDLDGFRAPDYCNVNIADLAKEALHFLAIIEQMLKEAAVAQYPLGLILRTAESDGNYGCCHLYEKGGHIILVPSGGVKPARYTTWHEALATAQNYLTTTMNQEKETRVVISRLLKLADSPGMSVVVMDGQVESLRWNGQLQDTGSKACVGTSTYRPKNAHVAYLQRDYEDQAVAFFETLLRKTAHRCGVDFASLRGVANLDLMLAGPLERQLQKKRGQKPTHYLAECNPRWTNYTDAIMTVIGVNRKEQNISNMRTVIQEGVVAIDKYHFSQSIDPRVVRECIFQRDELLKHEGTRVICRMLDNPMGLIFTGDIEKAQQEFAAIVRQLAKKKF